MEFHKIH